MELRFDCLSALTVADMMWCELRRVEYIVDYSVENVYERIALQYNDNNIQRTFLSNSIRAGRHSAYSPNGL